MADVSFETVKTMEGVEVRPAYKIHEIRMDQDLNAILPEWTECNARFTDHTVVCDPKWLQARFELEKANIVVYLLERGDEIVGAVPLEFSAQALSCLLGDLTLAAIPMKRIRLLGYTPNIPAEESACDLVFQRLLAIEFDAIYMTCIRVDSFFWQYLNHSPLIKKHFHFHTVRGIRSHPIVRITGSFDDYMRKFSSRTRNNLFRQIRKLREKGKVELVRVTEESKVDSFVDAAAEVSRNTYQFRVMGMGIRSPEKLKRWLKWAARQGWLRSYLLNCGGAPCAFQVAYQYDRIFLGVEVGYDPAWSKLGVGIVQQLLALEDLFKEKAPETCDFGGYADYKQFFANESYSDSPIWLFRRRPYPLLVLSAYRLCDATSRTARNVLDRFNLTRKIRRLLRRQ